MTSSNPRYYSFLKKHGWKEKEISFLAGDASNRRYYRLGTESSEHVLLMDAPPPMENIENFIQIDKILWDMGFSVPEILATDPDQGLALVEDFGDHTYTRILEDKTKYDLLYETAVDTLIALHKRFDPKLHMDLQPYTLTEYMREANLFIEWYYPKIFKQDLSQSGRKAWDHSWKEAFNIVLDSQKSLVLRDYHIDNLVWLKNREGIQRCGLLDFQDALIGSTAYDLVSLLEDARHDVPKEIQSKMIARYLDAFPKLGHDVFFTEYYTVGAQRSTKIIGIFSRLAFRDGKRRYLSCIPRLWKWLEGDLVHPHLKSLKEWFDYYVPQGKREVPHEN
jgi:hypothetical protein